MDERSDAAIIAASIHDLSRFEAIFDRHFRPIHRYLHRRVGVDLADDLAAETFIVAFGRRASFDQRQELARPWLFGIAINLLRNHRRAERRQLSVLARTADRRDVAEPFAEADERLDAARAAPDIARALIQLRNDDREVLLLFAWASLTYEEIAVALGIPIGTVRSRLARARRTTRELLGRSGQETSVPAELGGDS